MLRVKIQSNKHNVHIDCPNCDNWEQLGIDDPRKMLSSLPIIEWLPDEDNKNEESIHECTDCKTKFIVEWDYNNPIVEV